VGILFRKEASAFRSGSRNLIENCVIRDNGTEASGIGIDIRGRTQDITVRNTRLVGTTEKKQGTGIRIGQEAGLVVLQGNTYEGCTSEIADLRPSADRQGRDR
jgi:hypothetical protein